MKKGITLSFCAILLLGGCSTTSLNQNAGKISGSAIGAGVGAVIGKQVAGDIGTISGALVGASLGYFIGDQIDKRRAALSEIAKKEGIKVQSKEIVIEDVESESKGDLFVVESNEKQFIRDEKNEEELKDETKTIYKEFANEYKTSNKKLLIVSHTDDNGDSLSNQKITEKRAKEIAKIFNESGISKENIYYAGAGDSQPIADNKTDIGKKQNNRIEIVELEDEDQILKYSNKEIKPEYISPNKDILKKRSSKNFIDFKGEKVFDNKLADNEKFGEFSKANGFSFITKAFANDVVNESYFNCLYDKPRVMGKTMSLKEDTDVNRISEYKKGMYGTTWLGNIDDNLIGIFPVKVLKDGLKIKDNPKIAIYKKYIMGMNKEADYKIKTKVNTYQGSKGILYRVFADDENAPFKCIDIIFDETNMNNSIANIYYAKDDKNYKRKFEIKQLTKRTN